MMDVLSCTQPGRFEYIKSPIPESLIGHSIIRIRRIGICGTDLHAYRGTQPYFKYPRVLGHEIAAEYVSGGSRGLKTGDLCTVMPYISCGHCQACKIGKTNCCKNLIVCGVHMDGAMAEYFSIPDELVIPAGGLNVEELALLEPLAIAAHGIRRVDKINGNFVLIMGAGPIGLGLVIMAQHSGASVCLMDINEDRLQFASQNFKVTYTFKADDPTILETLKTTIGEDLFPVVIDATGNLRAVESGLQYLGHGGEYILVGLQKEAFSFSHPEFHKRETTLKSSRNATLQDFNQVKQAIWDRSINVTPLITHRMPFDRVSEQFESLYDPVNRVIKALIEF